MGQRPARLVRTLHPDTLPPVRSPVCIGVQPDRAGEWDLLLYYVLPVVEGADRQISTAIREHGLV
jgi:hypothetical protein